jgi:hypothetical protein
MVDLVGLPAFTPEQVKGARLYADRRDMLAHLEIPHEGNVVEVGVAFGDLSQFLVEKLAPKHFVAVDNFRLHHVGQIWGLDPNVVMDGRKHLDWYQSNFPEARCIRGQSAEGLSTLPDAWADLIYVDAGHFYEDVKADITAGAPKVRPGGHLVFNDYTLEEGYGVVPAVHELVAQGGWQVCGLALEPNMYCDVALRKGGETWD